jgi:flagellar hook assembly protein FlgD
VTLAVHPNPFRDTAQLTLRGAPAGRVEIVDAAGRLVRRFAATGSAGEQRIVWDGRDEAGRSVPPGAYFVRAGAPVQGRAVIIRLR